MRLVHGKVANPVLRKTVQQLLLQRLQPDAGRADDDYIRAEVVGGVLHPGDGKLEDARIIDKPLRLQLVQVAPEYLEQVLPFCRNLEPPWHDLVRRESRQPDVLDRPEHRLSQTGAGRQCAEVAESRLQATEDLVNQQGTRLFGHEGDLAGDHFLPGKFGGERFERLDPQVDRRLPAAGNAFRPLVADTAARGDEPLLGKHAATAKPGNLLDQSGRVHFLVLLTVVWVAPL